MPDRYLTVVDFGSWPKIEPRRLSEDVLTDDAKGNAYDSQGTSVGIAGSKVGDFASSSSEASFFRKVTNSFPFPQKRTNL